MEHVCSSGKDGNPNNIIHSNKEDCEPPLFLGFPSPFFDDNDIIENVQTLLQAANNKKSLNMINEQPPPSPSESKGLKKRRRRTSVDYCKKDRHSKIHTAQGLRDRRMRLSLHIAKKFFHLQDLLGFDKASNTIDWLFSKSNQAIKEVVAHKLTMTRHHQQIHGVHEIINVITTNKSTDHNFIKNKESKKKRIQNTSTSSREQARARARERTRERLMIKQLDEKSKVLFDQGNPNSDIDEELIRKLGLGYGVNHNPPLNSSFGFMTGINNRGGCDAADNFITDDYEIVPTTAPLTTGDTYYNEQNRPCSFFMSTTTN